MLIFKYIILGIIQGFTEPLPISSSGHLQIFQELFNTNMFNDDLNFEIIVHFGSLLAILFIFRKDIKKLIDSFFKFIFTKDKEKKKKLFPDFKYVLLIIVATIPVTIIGFLLKDFIEDKMSSIKLVGFALLITALALFVIRNIKGMKDDKDITYKDAILIGLLQAVAIFPGISRSGIVLVGCLLRDFKRDVALKYTFMLFFPVTIGAMVLGTTDLIKAGNLNEVLIPYLFGFIASLIVTYFAFLWLRDLVKKGKLWKFAIYCIIMGLFVLFYFR